MLANGTVPGPLRRWPARAGWRSSATVDQVLVADSDGVPSRAACNDPVIDAEWGLQDPADDPALSGRGRPGP